MPTKDLSKVNAGTLIHGSAGASGKYLPAWIERNKATFEDCMERIADELPHKYCELFIKMIQIANQQQPAPKQTNIDTMNVNVSSKLDALGDVHDTSWRNATDYTNYEEVNNEK